MKKPLFTKLISLMLLAVFLVLAGCQQGNIPVPEVPTQVPATEEPAAIVTPTPEPTAAPTVAPTAEPTATAAATPTPTIEATPTPSVSATPKASATPVPVGNSKYTLYVYIGSQLVVCYDQEGTPVKVMICSTGTNSNPTPTGTFKLGRKNDHRHLDGAWGQYCSNIINGIWFHSTPIAEKITLKDSKGNYTTVQWNDPKSWNYAKACVRAGAYRALGSKASHGCVRMLVCDAKWIYNNCPSGIEVHIVTDKYSGPKVGYTSPPAMKNFNKYNDPEFSTIGWDPTDPAYNGGASDPTPTPTLTPTIAPSQTPNVTPTPTQEPDPTPTPTPTKEPDPTPTPTPTQEPNPTPTKVPDETATPPETDDPDE